VLLQIEDVLAMTEVARHRAALLTEADMFVAGKATAGWAAKAVKNNDQSAGPAAQAAMAAAQQAVMQNPVFKAAARPKEIMGLLVSRYRSGMAYGLHVDDALMGGRRTDLSFTLFLSDPADYDGGELVIEDNDGSNAIKLTAGSLILYPTTSLHRVADVTRGERLAIVGWVRSYIRRADQREILFDLDQTVAALQAAGTTRDVMDRVFKTRNNLLRMWAED
jgi:PKHD-type hydroxylase